MHPILPGVLVGVNIHDQSITHDTIGGLGRGIRIAAGDQRAPQHPASIQENGWSLLFHDITSVDHGVFFTIVDPAPK